MQIRRPDVLKEWEDGGLNTARRYLIEKAEGRKDPIREDRCIAYNAKTLGIEGPFELYILAHGEGDICAVSPGKYAEGSPAPWAPSRLARQLIEMKLPHHVSGRIKLCLCDSARDIKHAKPEYSGIFAQKLAVELGQQLPDAFTGVYVGGFSLQVNWTSGHRQLIRRPGKLKAVVGDYASRIYFRCGDGVRVTKPGTGARPSETKAPEGKWGDLAAKPAPATKYYYVPFNLRTTNAIRPVRYD